MATTKAAPFVLKFKGNKTFGAPFSQLSDEDSLTRVWKVCTKVAAHLEQGQRLENLSWRLWYLHSLTVDESSLKHRREFKKLSKGVAEGFDKERGKPLEELTIPEYRSNDLDERLASRAAAKSKTRRSSKGDRAMESMLHTFELDPSVRSSSSSIRSRTNSRTHSPSRDHHKPQLRSEDVDMTSTTASSSSSGMPRPRPRNLHMTPTTTTSSQSRPQIPSYPPPQSCKDPPHSSFSKYQSQTNTSTFHHHQPQHGGTDLNEPSLEELLRGIETVNDGTGTSSGTMTPSLDFGNLDLASWTQGMDFDPNHLDLGLASTSGISDGSTASNLPQFFSQQQQQGGGIAAISRTSSGGSNHPTAMVDTEPASFQSSSTVRPSLVSDPNGSAFTTTSNGTASSISSPEAFSHSSPFTPPPQHDRVRRLSRLQEPMDLTGVGTAARAASSSDSALVTGGPPDRPLFSFSNDDAMRARRPSTSSVFSSPATSPARPTLSVQDDSDSPSYPSDQHQKRRRGSHNDYQPIGGPLSSTQPALIPMPKSQGNSPWASGANTPSGDLSADLLRLVMEQQQGILTSASDSTSDLSGGPSLPRFDFGRFSSSSLATNDLSPQVPGGGGVQQKPLLRTASLSSGSRRLANSSVAATMAAAEYDANVFADDPSSQPDKKRRSSSSDTQHPFNRSLNFSATAHPVGHPNYRQLTSPGGGVHALTPANSTLTRSSSTKSASSTSSSRRGSSHLLPQMTALSGSGPSKQQQQKQAVPPGRMSLEEQLLAAGMITDPNPATWVSLHSSSSSKFGNSASALARLPGYGGGGSGGGNSSSGGSGSGPAGNLSVLPER